MIKVNTATIALCFLGALPMAAVAQSSQFGPDQGEQQAMLDALGLASREQLIEQTVPPAIRLQGELNLPSALDEQAALAKLKGYAE